MTESADKQRDDGMAQGVIDDPGKFRALTGRSHELASLHAYSGLDVLIDPARLVSAGCTALRDTGELARLALQAVPSATAPLT